MPTDPNPPPPAAANPSPAPGHRRVFISYSHDSPAHRDQVLALSERLRRDGIDTGLDRYIEGSPVQGWPRWMLDQLDAADSVLVVCTETYYRRFRGHAPPGTGRGVDWEGALITQELYDSRSRTLKFVPVFLAAPDPRWIPEPLRAISHYRLDSAEHYQALYDFLLGQSAVLPGALGVPLHQARPQGRALEFGPSATSAPSAPPANPAAPSVPALAASAGPLRAGLVLAALAALGVALAAWQPWRTATPAATPATPTPAAAPPPTALAPPAGPLRQNVEVAFEPHALMKDFGPPSGLELILDLPERTGPFGFKAEPAAHFLHFGFGLPGPGKTLGGTLQRVLQSAHNVTADNVKALSTHLCLRQTTAAPPPDGVLRLACSEADACRPIPPAGILVPCGERVGRARWPGPAWLPSAMAQPTATAATAVTAASASPSAPINTGPAPGDWLVPRLDSLRAQRGSAKAVAFSEVTLRIDAPRGAELADAASYEVAINGRRLWVNGMPAWTHAVPLQPGQALTLAFGLENLDAAGQDAGREQVDVKLVLLRNKQVVADDSVRLRLTALRTQGEQVARSAAGQAVRWSVRYWPTQADQYQMFAYGGGQADTLAALAKFNTARLTDPQPGGLPLRGVVRPPLDGKAGWGVSVAELQANGQLRFSFDRPRIKALCEALQQALPTAALRRQGFKDPGGFRVREIAVAVGDDRPKPQTECRNFSAS